MQIREIVDKLGIKVLAGGDHLDNEVTGCYVTDLLSCVIAGADVGDLWVTLQTHVNVVAVAALQELAAVLIAESAPVPEATLEKAEAQSMVVLASAEPVYETVKKLAALGI